MIDYKIYTRTDDRDGVRVLVHFYSGDFVRRIVSSVHEDAGKKVTQYVRTALIDTRSYTFPISADNAAMETQFRKDLASLGTPIPKQTNV